MGNDSAAEANTRAGAGTTAVKAARADADQSTTVATDGAAARVSNTSASGAKTTVKASGTDARQTGKTAASSRQGSVSAGGDTAEDATAVSDTTPAQQATVQATAAGAGDLLDASEAMSAAGAVRSNAGHSEDSADVDLDANAASPVADADASAGAAEAAAAASVAHAAANAISAEAATALSQASSEKHVHAAESAATATSTSTDGTTSGAAQLNAGSTSAANGASDVAPTPTLQVHANVESVDFAQGLSDKVSWMVGNGVNSAKLQVNPPQLGPIELSISVTGDHAQVSMITHSAITRDALESSSPALKDMLGSQGFGQVSVDISQRSFQERSAYTPPSYDRASSSSAKPSGTSAVASIATTSSRVSRSVLDAYA